MRDKLPLEPLYYGHKPVSIMIDKRNTQQFALVKAGKDKPTLELQIYKTHPVLMRQHTT